MRRPSAQMPWKCFWKSMAWLAEPCSGPSSVLHVQLRRMSSSFSAVCSKSLRPSTMARSVSRASFTVRGLLRKRAKPVFSMKPSSEIGSRPPWRCMKTCVLYHPQYLGAMKAQSMELTTSATGCLSRISWMGFFMMKASASMRKTSLPPSSCSARPRAMTRGTPGGVTSPSADVAVSTSPAAGTGTGGGMHWPRSRRCETISLPRAAW
mmetsp:Transcript_140534/g.437027  ORF Transcript_140534/g.437027 Transcript_140534/m.437027 type:complete len:208 (-) Transcript_140534:346-969(-)